MANTTEPRLEDGCACPTKRQKTKHEKDTSRHRSLFTNTDFGWLIRFLLPIRRSVALLRLFSCYKFNNYLALHRRKTIKEKTRLPFLEPTIFLPLTLHTQTLRCKRKICEYLHAARKTLLLRVAKHQSLQVCADVDTLNILLERHAWGQRLLILWINTRTWSPRKARTLTLTRPGTNSPKYGSGSAGHRGQDKQWVFLSGAF